MLTQTIQAFMEHFVEYKDITHTSRADIAVGLKRDNGVPAEKMWEIIVKMVDDVCLRKKVEEEIRKKKEHEEFFDRRKINVDFSWWTTGATKEPSSKGKTG